MEASFTNQLSSSSLGAAGNRLQAATDAITQQARAENPKLAAQAKQFEAYFVQHFISLMQPEPDKESEFSGGIGEQMFHGQLQEKMGQAIAESGGFGLADAIVRQAQGRAAYAKILQTERGQ